MTEDDFNLHEELQIYEDRRKLERAMKQHGITSFSVGKMVPVCNCGAGLEDKAAVGEVSQLRCPNCLQRGVEVGDEEQS